MDSTQFVFWLQGFFELSDSKTLSEKQVQVIKDHLALFLNKVTPDRNNVSSWLSREQQTYCTSEFSKSAIDKLNKISEEDIKKFKNISKRN